MVSAYIHNTWYEMQYFDWWQRVLYVLLDTLCQISTSAISSSVVWDVPEWHELNQKLIWATNNLRSSTTNLQKSTQKFSRECRVGRTGRGGEWQTRWGFFTKIILILSKVDLHYQECENLYYTQKFYKRREYVESVELDGPVRGGEWRTRWGVFTGGFHQKKSN